MEYVSLLPPEIKTRRQQQRRQAVLIRVAIVLFIIILIVYSYLLVSSIMARNTLESLRDERANLENQAAALEQYEILYNDMRAAEEIVITAMGQAPPWSELMTDLGLTLPPGVWLSSMSLNYGAEEGTFNMQGWTYTHSGVAEMLDEIEKMEQLSDIRVQTSSETTFDGRDAVQFTINAVVLPGSAYLDREEEGA